MALKLPAYVKKVGWNFFSNCPNRSIGAHHDTVGVSYPKGKDPNIVNISIGDTTLLFDTSSPFSRKWFFPRYSDGTPHEKEVVNEVLKDFTNTACFLDIGANIGFYTVLAGVYGCQEGSVHAFEMDPRLLYDIYRNVELNNLENINFVSAAVWDSSGNCLPFVPHQVGNLSTNRIQASSTNTFKNYAISISIDSYCKQHNVVPSVCKIDVEGAEIEVLQGMKMALNSLSTLILEIHPGLFDDRRKFFDGIYDNLSPFSWDIKYLEEHKRGGEMSKISLQDLDHHTLRNGMLVCRKNS